MPTESALDVAKDFEYLLGFLPPGWQDQAKGLGALRRCRKIPNAETLLRVLLIHLAEGCSLRETSVRAREGGIIDLRSRKSIKVENRVWEVYTHGV